VKWHRQVHETAQEPHRSLLWAARGDGASAHTWHMSLPASPSGWQPEDVLTRIQQLEPYRDDNIKGQHVVSQVLLKRFARKAGSGGWELHSFDTKHPERRPKAKGPNGCGKVPNFIRFASRSSEELWQKVEDRLPAALAAADNESIVRHPEHIATVKDAIALHFVRSMQMATVHQWAWQTAKTANRQQLLDQPGLLERLFIEQVGLHAAGLEALELVVETLHAPTQELIDSGAMFRGRIEYIYAKTRDMIDSSSVQIAKPTRGEFLIGDVPAVSVKKGQPGVGVLGGVALGEATTVLLPLGRYCCAALARADEVIRLDFDAVQALNKAQLQAAYQYIYFHPASGLEHFARTALTNAP
jgi:hypothetical protein